jgi:phage terminase small subunit
MGILPNPQHEIFARELVELRLGCDKQANAKAYIAAGYAERNAESNGRRLSNRPHIKNRFKELFAEACAYRDIRPAAIVVRIDRVGSANIADFYEADPDHPGKVRLKDITKLPRELSAAIEQIKWTDNGPELKLADKNQANFTLLKHFGGLPADPSDGARNTQVNFFNGLSLDDQRALAEVIEAFIAGAAKPRLEASGEPVTG